MFILIIFLVLHVCVNAKYYEVKHSNSQNNILGNLSPNSRIDLRALKHLAKVFPNHAIEIQIQGSQYEVPKIQNKHMKNRRLRENGHFYQKWPYRIEAHIIIANINQPIIITIVASIIAKKIKRFSKPCRKCPNQPSGCGTSVGGRSGENTYLNNSLLANAGASNQILPTTTTTTTTTTMTTKLETSPTSSIRHVYPHQPTDELRRPLYMEDLIQALEDFEKKLVVDHGNSSTNYGDRPVVKKDIWDLEKILSTDCNADTESGSYDQPTIPLSDHRNMAVKNFYDVVRLINKGVKVQLEVTTPRQRDSHMKWVPIKVPKGIM